MADYGNHFTSNSRNYNYNTRGHSFDDSDWVIVELANSGNVSQPIPHPNGAEFTGNDTTCYFYTTNHMTIPNREVKIGNDYVAYFNWATDNKNVKGSIDGNFDCYLFGSKTDSRFVEPIGLDDTKHGVSPYSDSNNNAIYRTNLTVKGTTFTAGYRRHKIQYEPSIKYDLVSYNYGTNDNYKSDGKTKATGTRVLTSRYDAFQTFYNIEDPYSVLNISIANHDNIYSSSPTFCTLAYNKSEYRINHNSYTYNPYKNSATWNNTNYLSFTYNTLPTYPKILVFEYDDNYNSVSYDGGSVNVEAKAWYDGKYDRFTTSTANDEGFSSYKRYVDVTYSLSTFNSSNTPTGSSTYTFRIWQPGSKLGISYTWSIDSNPSWAHLSKTTGNTTKVTFDDQGDDKPSVGGTLSLALDATTISNGGSTTGSVTGVSWTPPTNRSARSCTLRQNMTVTNCCAQNITPKDIKGQPYQALTLTQHGMHWNNPSFIMKWKVTQGSKTTTTYNDDYDHGWPIVSIGNSSTAGGREMPTSWTYDTPSKSVSISMPNISRPWVNTYSNGKVTITKGSNDAVSYKGGDVTIKLHPDITFRQGFTSGVSERTWTISNTANTPTNQEYWTLKEFKSVDIKLPAIGAANHAFGNATLSWKDTGAQDLTFSKASKTWNNDNTDDSFTATLASNPPIIGNWYASASDGTLTFTSTTKNSSATSATISFSGSTYQDGVLTPSPSTITISQNGTNISGTITIKGTGEGINSCDGSTKYPVDGKSTSAHYSLKSAKQLYVTGQKNLTPGVNYTTIPWYGATITISKSSGTVETESATSKKQDYSISVSSNIISSKPANPANGIVLSGSVQPNPANYKYQYKVDTGSWSDSTTKYIQSNDATWDRDCSLDLKSSDEWTDVNEGIYKYTSGYYKTADPIDHTIKIRVVDINNSSITYEGNSITVPQNGQEGWHDEIAYTFVTSGVNCTTSKPVGPADKSYNESIDYGAFTVSNITPPDPNPSGDTGSSENISTYIYNYSDKLSEGNFPTTKPTATFKGSSQEFKYNVPVSTYLGVKSISTLTVNYKHTGKKTWNYMYSFSIHPESPDGWIGDTQTTTKSSSGSVGPLTDSTYTAKMAVVEGTDTKNWQSLDTTGESTVHITKPGTYVIYVAWFNGDNKYNELNSSTITITSQQKQFRIKITLEAYTSKKIYWDSTKWELKVAGYQLQSKVGTDDWKNDSTSITGVKYTWVGTDSNKNNTATVNVSSVTPGTSMDNLGLGKIISVTVSSAEGYSGTGEFNLYRFGQDYGGYLATPFLSDGHVYVGSTPTKRSSTSTEYPDSLPAILTFSSRKKSGSGSLSVSGNKDFKSTTLDIGTYTQDSASLTWTTIKLDNVTVGAEEGTHDVTPTNSPNYTAGSDGKFTISVSTSWNVPDVDSPYTDTSDPTFNGQSTFDVEVPGEKLDVNDYYKWSFTPDKGVTGVTLSNNTKRTVKINYPNNPKPRGENITDEFNEWIWTNDSYVLTKEIKENKDKVGFYKVIGGVTGAQDSRPLGTLKLDYTKTGTSATTKVTQNGKTAGEQTNSATFKVSNQINCSCLVDTSISATGNNEDIAYITKFTTAGVKWNKASLNIKEGTFTKYGENYDKCSSTTTIDKPIKCTIGCTENTENNITVVAIPSAIIDRLKMNGISSNSSKTVVGPASNKMVKPKKRTIKYIWKLDGESYDETTNTIEVTTTPSTTGTRTFALDECTVTDEYENNSAYPEISGQTFITRYQLGYEWKFVVTTGTGYQYSIVIYSTKTQTQTETIEHLYWGENASTFNLNVYVRCWYRTTENGSDYNEWIEIADPKVTYSWKDSGNIITEANGNNTKVDLEPGKGYDNSKDKIVTCTATYKETYHSTCTFTLKHYGQTYLNTVDDLFLSDDNVSITMIPAKLSNKTSLYPKTLPGTIKFTSEKLNSIIDNGNGTLNLYDELIDINDCKSGNTAIKTGILIGKVTLDNGVLTWDNITLNTINDKIMVSASGGNEPISASDEPKYEPGKDTFFKINVDTKWNIPIEDTPYTNAASTRFDPKVSTPDLTQPSTSLTYTYFKIPAGKLDVDNYYSWSFEPSEGIDETKVYLDSKTIKSKICHLIYDKNEGESGSVITPAVNDWIKESSVILPKEIDDKSNDTTNYSKKLEFYTVTGGVSTGIKERPLGTIKLEYTYNKNTASASVVQQGTPNGKGTQSAEFEITKTLNCANLVIDKSISSEGAKTQSAYITKFTRIKKYEDTIINVHEDSFKTDSTNYDKCKSVTSISKPIKCTIGATEDRTGIKVVSPFSAIIKLSKKNDKPVQNNTKVFIGPPFIENLPLDAIIKYNWLCDGKKYDKTTKTIEVTTTPDVIGIRTFKLDSVDISTTIENHEINKKYELKDYEWTFEVTSMTAIYNLYVYCGTNVNETNTTQTIEHTYFDTNASTFDLSVHIVCEMATSTDGVNFGDFIVIDDPGVTYNWDYGNSTTSTNKVTVSAGKNATDGNTTDVTCTISYGGSTASCTFTLKNYGATVDFTGTLTCSDDKTITAFDPQTYDTTASISDYKVTATSGTSTKDWTKTYNYTLNATKHTLTAVQGTDASTLGTSSYEYTFVCPIDKIPKNIHIGTDASTSHTVNLYCYGKSYYNQ